MELKKLYKFFFSYRSNLNIEYTLAAIATGAFIFKLGQLLITSWSGDITNIINIGQILLGAISLPFTIILIYEVYQLIKSISLPLIESISIQYEITALILIRNIFKDLSVLDNISTLTWADASLQNLTFDVIGAIGIYILVLAFNYIKDNKCRGINVIMKNNDTIKIRAYLSVLFVIINVLFLGLFSYVSISQGIFDIEIVLLNFLKNILFVMVIFDVLIVVISSVLKDSFNLIFLDAALIISVIMLRIGISASSATNLIFIALSFVIAIGTFWLFVKSYKLKNENC